MSSKKILCFGELLLRLSPKDNWVGNHNMPFYIGSTELNVAVALANWAIPVRYLTALPYNYLSKQLIEFLGSKNIVTSAVNFSGKRIGIYYLPFGNEIQHQGVIYDRANSSFSELKPGMIDWDEVLSDCGWFHFSAISVALSDEIASLCKQALEVCAAKNLTISIDLNYRSKLWQPGRRPVDVMPALVEYCDVIMGNIWSAESLLGIDSPIESSAGKSQGQLLDAANESINNLHASFPKAKTLAYTYRLQNSYLAAIQHENNWAVSNQLECANVVDKVGSGDCFMAGLIYGLCNNHDTKDIVDFAAIAAAGKLQEAGDYTNQTIESINKKR